MKILYAHLLIMLLFVSCKNREAAEEVTAPEEVRTPVTVTTIAKETITDSIILNATSAFIQDNIVKSSINGYITSVSIRQGQYATEGKNLFILKTKESESLGNTINKLDTSFHFTGVVNIRTPQSGYVSQLLHQVGDYVQDGEQL
ncbi:MAG TPA: hypothetical protein VLC28_04385, partial [Flavitalea sp.]|nr:hypothetical protein [Flavitalea sp.]